MAAGWREHDPGKKAKRAKSEPPEVKQRPPSTSPEPPKAAGWRRAGTAAPQQGKYWSKQGRRGVSSATRRRVQLTGLLILFLGMVSAIVIYAINYPRTLPLILIPVGNYEFPTPPLAMDGEDVALLANAFGPEYRNVTLSTASAEADNPQDMLIHVEDLLKNVVPGGPWFARSVVIYIRAHGVVNDAGAPCLLLPKSQRLSDKTWLPVRDLLDKIETSTTKSAKNIMLVLDTCQLRRNWSSGMLHNAFASELERLVEGRDASRIAVLHSVSPGQTSQIAPELGGSAFGYYFTEGLRGAAAGDDDEVTARELETYVRRRVGGFAKGKRMTEQTPVLLPRTMEDFNITKVQGRYEIIPAETSLASGIEQISRLWSEFGEVAKRKPYTTSPTEWAELGAKLVRLDQLVLAGNAYQKQFDSSFQSLEASLGKLRSVGWGDVQEAASLAVADVFDPLSATQLSATQNAYLKWKQALAEAGGDQSKSPPLELTHRDAAALAWSQAGRGDLSSLDESLSWLRENKPPSRKSPDFNELYFLKLLRSSIDRLGDGPQLLAATINERQAAEATAAPSDLRAHYWSSWLVKKADERDHQLLDAVLEGSAAAVAKGKRQAEEAAAEYAEARRVNEKLIAAYDIRDKSLATFPALFAWVDAITFLKSTGVATSLPEDDLLGRLKTLLEDSHRLADQLDLIPPELDEVADVADVAATTVAVENTLNQLLKNFDEHCRNLEQDTTDQATLREIAAVLDVPPLPDEDVEIRTSLRKKFFHRFERAGGMDVGEVEPDPGSDATIKYTQLLNTGPKHLLLASLATDRTPDVAATDSLPAAEKELRGRLRQASRLIVELETTTFSALDKASPPPAWEARQGLSWAGQQARAAIGVLGEPTWEKDPCSRLRNFDRHAYLLWQGQRGLDSWWGSIDGVTAPYFLAVARDQLRHAAEVFPDGKTYRAEFKDRVDGTEREFLAWRPIEAGNFELDPEQPSAPHSIAVTPLGKNVDGTCAVFLQSEIGDLVPVLDYETNTTIRRRGASTSVASTLKHRIANPGEQQLDAVALFRGTRFQSGIFMDRLRARISEYAFNTPPTPTVRVKGNARQRSDVIFILDCSDSMGENENGRTRMSIAKSALSETLKRLAKQKSFNVLVVLYGNRAGWQPVKDETGKTRYEIKHRTPQAKAMNLHPGEDVERVVGWFEPFDPSSPQYDELMTSLDSVTNYGETPLFRSIVQSLEWLPPSRAGVNQAIVMITDGQNRQWSENPPPSGSTSFAAVRTAWAKKRPQLFLLGVKANDPDLKALVNQSGGSSAENIRADDLSRKIEETLNLKRFAVRPNPTNIEPKDLGDTWTVDTRSGTIFNVYINENPNTNVDVRLLGGEALDLVHNPSRGKLEFERFRENQSDTQDGVSVPSPEDPRQYLLGHIPEVKSPEEVWFQVSVQNGDETLFSPKPRGVWAEIRPDGGGRNDTFFAYDLDFVQGKPVPLLRFRLRKWPTARRAEMRVWYSYEDPPAKSFPLRLNDVTNIEFSEHVKVQASVNRSAEGTKIVVRETHEEPSLYPLQIQIDPPVDKSIERRFYNEGEQKRADHIFSYELGPNRAKLLISTAKDIKQRWNEAKIEVELPR